MQIRCPICKAERTVADDFEFRPFCSSRCKKVDLLNWLEGRYSLPRELLPEEIEQLPSDQQEALIAQLTGEEPPRGTH